MPGTIETLKQRLIERLSPRGETAKFCHETKISRSVVERWLEDEDGVPGINSLDKIAAAFKMEPWELIKPEGEDADIEEIASVLRRLKRENPAQFDFMIQSLRGFLGLPPARDQSKDGSGLGS